MSGSTSTASPSRMPPGAATPAARASIRSVWAATTLTPTCTAASIFSPGRPQPIPPTAPSAATSLSVRSPRMTTCIRAKPAPSATAAATTHPIAAGTTASPLPAAMKPCAGSSSTAVATARKRKTTAGPLIHTRQTGTPTPLWPRGSGSRMTNISSPAPSIITIKRTTRIMTPGTPTATALSARQTRPARPAAGA